LHSERLKKQSQPVRIPGVPLSETAPITSSGWLFDVQLQKMSSERPDLISKHAFEEQSWFEDSSLFPGRYGLFVN